MILLFSLLAEIELMSSSIILKADLQEMNNLYGSPDYAEVQTDLENRLTSLRIQY